MNDRKADIVNNKKRALVLGTNAGQADLIRYLKNDGWYVVGCSGRSGEPGQTLCDVFEKVDIRNVDALEPLVSNHDISLIYSISSDLAMKSVVALAERTGLPHFFDSPFIALLDNKASLRKFLADRRLSPVTYLEVGKPVEAEDWTSFPCVVKPADAQGQRGVQKVEDRSAFHEAVRDAIDSSPSGLAIVEDFLDGVEMSCNVVLQGGKPVLKVLSERLVHDFEKIGIPEGHLVPAISVSRKDQECAIELVDRVVAALDQTDGVLYFQMINSDTGPKIIEIAPRLDGCHMWRIIEQATGQNLIRLATEMLTGDKLIEKYAESSDPKKFELMFQQMAPGKKFDEADFPKPADCLYHEYRYAPGEIVQPVNGTLEVVGYYIRETT